MTSTTQMRAALLYGPGDIRVENRPVPRPGPDEVQIQVAFTGVCGTDLHHYDGWDFGDILSKPEPPAILGHEFSGVVSDLGESVSNWEIGLVPNRRFTAETVPFVSVAVPTCAETKSGSCMVVPGPNSSSSINAQCSKFQKRFQ